jgi:hypothetical protein
MADFMPPAPIADFLDARKISTVNVRFGNIAEGALEVRTAAKGDYRIKKQPLALAHPAFARVAEFAPGLAPALFVAVQGQKITGEVGLAAGEKFEKIAHFIQKTPELLGLAGFTIGSLPTATNTLDGGSLHFGLAGVPVKLGSAFSGTVTFDVIDSTVTFDGNAAVAVKGLANGSLELKRAADGSITGKAAVALTLPKNFSGSVDVAWDGATVSGVGKVGYKGEKFSGDVTLMLMEKTQALQLAQAKSAPQGAAPKPAAAGAKQPAKIEYVVFGEGDLAFSFTDWLNGTAHVIVDPKGNVTVIGEIKPQKEFLLFAQKDYDKQLFKVEARATYGLPVVGDVFIFANASMNLFASLGPAKFYNIVIDGTYSTDPAVAKNFSIRGSLNISAVAGARLRAEAGVGVEILSHDIKAGAGINGTAGVKAYAEATPIIGYREKGAEGQDLKGEWFIRGDLEVAAQPFLGLSGDLFVELETPWWSPLSDHKWTWPLFGKEWPLGGTMGMLVSVDYVFGSGQWPKFDFKPVEFDSAKFLTSMYDDKAQSGTGKEIEQKGSWAEKNSAAAQPPPKSSPPGNAKPGKSPAPAPAKSKKVSGSKSGKPADPSARTKEGKSVKELQERAQKRGKGPAGKEAGKGAKSEPGKKDQTKEPQDDVITKQLTLNGIGHTLEVEAHAGRAHVYLASHRQDLATKLNAEAEAWSQVNDEGVRNAAQQLVARLGKVKEREQALAKIYADTADDKLRHALAVAGVNEIAQMLVGIAAEFGITFEDEAVLHASAYHPSGLSLGRATRVYADPLTIESLRPRQAQAQFAPGGSLNFPGRNTYAAGHLLADTFGGSNDPANLALMSRGTNGKFSSIEAKIRNALRGTKKLQEPRTVLRYEIASEFEGDPAGQLEAWMQARYGSKLPGAKFAGVGAVILAMVAGQKWDRDAIAHYLGVSRNDLLPYDDAIKAKTARLYLPTGFTISITVRAGRGVSLEGGPIANHIGAPFSSGG